MKCAICGCEHNVINVWHKGLNKKLPLCHDCILLEGYFCNYCYFTNFKKADGINGCILPYGSDVEIVEDDVSGFQKEEIYVCKEFIEEIKEKQKDESYLDECESLMHYCSECGNHWVERFDLDSSVPFECPCECCRGE